jgi:hypothetical protein
MKLTLQKLIDNDACESQRDLFCELFGDSVEVTEEAALSAADKFDWSWAFILLPASVQQEYRAIRQMALAEYDRVCLATWENYVHANAAAWAKCSRISAVAWARLYCGATK